MLTAINRRGEVLSALSAGQAGFAGTIVSLHQFLYRSLWQLYYVRIKHYQDRRKRVLLLLDKWVH